jgi:hypothetical protein
VSKQRDSEAPHAVPVPLLQNMSIVSVGKVSLVSTRQADIIYTIRKKVLFSIDCFEPIPKLIIGIGWLNTADTNKYPV